MKAPSLDLTPGPVANAQPFLPEDDQSATKLHVCVVLHDVRPAHWGGCGRVLRRLHAVAKDAGVALPITLLVVPRMHDNAGVSSLYLRWLHGLARSGHETALDGFTQLDQEPPARSWQERFVRRTFAKGEAAHSTLALGQAAERLAASRAWAVEHGLQATGFVAPAWMLGDESWPAVAQAGFDYTCTPGAVVALPDRHLLRAQSLVFSTRTGWRRWLSVPLNNAMAWQQKGAPMLRLDLHPSDSDHPAVERCWSRMLAQALLTRRPLLLRQAAKLAQEVES